MGYNDPERDAGPVFSIFGEGVFRYISWKTLDWTDNGVGIEKLTNEGWIALSSSEAARVVTLHVVQW